MQSPARACTHREERERSVRGALEEVPLQLCVPMLQQGGQLVKAGEAGVMRQRSQLLYAVAARNEISDLI